MNVIDRAGFQAVEARDRGEAALRGEIRPDLIRDEVLAEIFGATAKARGGHTALVFGTERLTYAEVDARTDALARGLVRRSIGPGDVVGLWMCRGAELLIAQIAVVKSAPPGFPSTRMRRSTVLPCASRTRKPRAC
jgi:non-ribosomal peptide synthetase component F